MSIFGRCEFIYALCDFLGGISISPFAMLLTLPLDCPSVLHPGGYCVQTASAPQWVKNITVSVYLIDQCFKCFIGSSFRASEVAFCSASLSVGRFLPPQTTSHLAVVNLRFIIAGRLKCGSSFWNWATLINSRLVIVCLVPPIMIIKSEH